MMGRHGAAHSEGPGSSSPALGQASRQGQGIMVGVAGHAGAGSGGGVTDLCELSREKYRGPTRELRAGPRWALAIELGEEERGMKQGGAGGPRRPGSGGRGGRDGAQKNPALSTRLRP